MSEQYFILDKGQKLGPFTNEELLDRPLEPDDMVLSPDETDFKPAHSLVGFDEYFRSEGIYYPTPYNTAAYILRLPAYIIDFFIVMVPTVLVGFILFPNYLMSLQPDIGTTPLPTDELIKRITANAQKHATEFILIELGVFLISVVYNATMESSRFEGSFGKYICGLAVVDELGYSINFAQALKRNGSKLLYQILSFVIGPFGYIAYLRIIWGGLHQGIHDRMAGCFVVKKNR